MYQFPGYKGSQAEEEERERAQRANMANSSQQSPLVGRSPSIPSYNPPYSPTSNSHSRPSYSGQYHPPTPAALPMPSSMSPQLRPPPSPSTYDHAGTNGSAHPHHHSREKSTSTYYDPTSDHGDSNAVRNSSLYSGSPKQANQSREGHSYPEYSNEQQLHNGTHQSPSSGHLQYQSPTKSSPHSHLPSRPDSYSNYPSKSAAPAGSPLMHSQAYDPLKKSTSSAHTPSRPSDPMAFSNILSNSTAEPSPTLRKVQSTEVTSPQNGRKPFDDALPPSSPPRAVTYQNSTSTTERPSLPKTNGQHIFASEITPTVVKLEKLAGTSDKENDETAAATAAIDDVELSDLDLPEFSTARARFKDNGRKRLLEIEKSERNNRKRRRLYFTERLADQLAVHVKQARSRFRNACEDEAVKEVQQKEVQDEKERKKDMQRKRRREKTVQNEAQKRDEALAKIQDAKDIAEKERLLKEAQRAEKKMRTTKRILDGVDVTKELREVSPPAPNLEGGIMDSFQSAKPAEEAEPGGKKKSGRGGARPRKSKEQKQAEKDAAEAAHAEMEKDELIKLAPKEEPEEVKPPAKPKSKKEAAGAEFVPYVSKGYNQIYDQIWRDLARKDIPKIFRLKNESMGHKHSNLRKTAQLASKEARRWQLRTNKSQKDVQARAKRCMREMMSFWKRNEREERDLRRTAEKQELENAKKAEAERENNRQKRKLNFLISQTELYSHFVGNKIKTDEVERSTDSPDVAVSGQTIESGKSNATAVALPESKLGKVTNFEDLDFGSDNEDNLQQAAVANAQNAIQEAQDRARAFNQGQEPKNAQEDFDEGEMNFQNPTSLGDVNISQPKMLNAQLKEYQLKGLNWLANLYEQGINGILADEMGLGKTIQSISVMAYLAEYHQIWGPFLVIAPASTLHNWQQEITRFVPDLKVLPYWGNAKDRKVLRKFWDRKHITYSQDAPFHVLVTSYQLVVQDSQYFQKIRWQYMILDEAQAIKSSQSSRWKNLLGFHCRNRLLLTGTPIQNNMQELWALLHFIMPSLFDNHEEFSEWFSKDIESHAQSNTKLNEDQLKRLHMILKPFMLRRIKKHVQKELGDKIEEDIVCDLTYRQRAYYGNLRNRISIMDLIEKAAVGDDQDTATLMNLVMQFRKVCNHPDLFERAEVTSPFSFAYFAETASFMREGSLLQVTYSTRNLIEYTLPRLIWREDGRLDLPGRDNPDAGFRGKYLDHLMNVWAPENIAAASSGTGAFSWLRFADASIAEASAAFYQSSIDRVVALKKKQRHLGRFGIVYDEPEDNNYTPAHAMFQIADRNPRKALAEISGNGPMQNLLNISSSTFVESGLQRVEQCARPAASAPPIEVQCLSRGAVIERQNIMFNVPFRRALYGPSEVTEKQLLEAKIGASFFPVSKMLPEPISDRQRFTNIQVPSMHRFVTDSGKLARLDSLLTQLKEGNHRVLLYFQMTRMIDLMEEYLTYRNFKYLRLDGSTKLEDRRDTVHDFQTRPEIFIFLLSTRAGGLGINLTAADTVIFYDSDWNPTIDSQAMDRAHRLGQTRQVTVYRMITRGTIEERIRKRALQKEEVQRVVISGGAGGGVDFNTRSRENRTKDIAMWLADDDQAAEIERKEAEIAAQEAKEPAGKKRAGKKRKADVSLDDMYHEGEGHFDDGSNKPSGTSTPLGESEPSSRGIKRPHGGKGVSKKAKTAKERLRMADGG